MAVREGFRPELVTDLYEFTMAAGYWHEEMFQEATFSLFVRDYPPNRGYFVAAGLTSFLDRMEDFSFDRESIDYLYSTGIFSDSFIDYLSEFRFTGSFRAIPEGRILFTQEPLLEVTAPLIEAQLLETLAINTFQLETMLATKAARCAHAAKGRGLVDFALRRTQGIDAGMKTARSSYITGFLGTSNVLAGKTYGIPVYGTMAHSFVTSFESELEAFQAYSRHFPDSTVLLIDTYDTLRGAENAVTVAKQLEAQGKRLRGVRLDSGDLLTLSRQVREILNRNGCGDVAIMASSNLDEYRLHDLLEAGAEIDIVGIGTRLGVSADAPSLDLAYKLVEYDRRPILKLSTGKKSWVGRKQVWRTFDEGGLMSHDTLGLETEQEIGGEALLEKVYENGERIRPVESLEAIRNRFAEEWKRLPEPYRPIRADHHYPVKISSALGQLQGRTAAECMRRELGVSDKP